MSFVTEFKEFALKGNVVDLAVGVIIGGAFQKIVGSLVKDVVMPVIGQLVGGVDFGELYINLGSQSYESLAAAEKAGPRRHRGRECLGGIREWHAGVVSRQGHAQRVGTRGRRAPRSPRR
jgi:hypothetical protein